jgi:peptidoglycan hydrolase CwlO-like protein
MRVTEMDIERLYNILDKLKAEIKDKQDKIADEEAEIISLKKAIFVLENGY